MSRNLPGRRRPRRLIAPAVAALAIGIAAACSGGGQQATAHHPSSPANPSPAGASPASGVPLPGTPSPGSVAVPVNGRSAGPATPRPSAAAPVPAGVTHAGQSLTFSGAVTGTASSAEVKQCGSSGTTWSLQLSNMSLPAGQVSLSLSVPSFTGAGSYRPQGTAMLIARGQASFYSVSGGMVQLTSARQGTLDLQFQGDGTIHLTGSWAC